MLSLQIMTSDNFSLEYVDLNVVSIMMYCKS